MARQSKKARASLLATEQSPNALARLELYYPVLVNCRLRRKPPPDGLEKETPERFYDCSVSTPSTDASDDLTAAFCNFSAGHRIKEERVLEITATYFLGFKARQDAGSIVEKHLVEQMIESSAWPMFRGLFIHIGSQSGAELPLLPNVPKINWATKEEAAKTSAPRAQ